VFTARYGLSPYILHGIKNWSHITEVDSVYCAIHTESLYETETFHIERLKIRESAHCCVVSMPYHCEHNTTLRKPDKFSSNLFAGTRQNT
jgi:hypothetical protein